MPIKCNDGVRKIFSAFVAEALLHLIHDFGFFLWVGDAFEEVRPTTIECAFRNELADPGAGGRIRVLILGNIEAFGAGTAIVVDDYRRIEVYRDGRRSVTRVRRDKGHRAELRSFAAALRGAEPPPDADGYLATTRATLALAQSLQTGLAVSLT